MIKPQFPYLNNQLILSSDRILLHSKTDAIFLFGKAAVSLSSPATINLDSNEKVLIDAPKIELGKKAEEDGEPVILGNQLNELLLELLRKISLAGTLMSQASQSEPAASMQAIALAGQVLGKEANKLIFVLSQNSASNPILSKTTFTT